MKPITYFVESPTIVSLCNRYGDNLEKLPVADRLALAKGSSETLLHRQGYGQTMDLYEACTADGHEFSEPLEPHIRALDTELTAPSQLSAFATALLSAGA